MKSYIFLILLLWTYAFSAPTKGESSNPNLITVSASSKVEVEPDMLTIEIGLQKNDSNPHKAQEFVNKQINQYITDLKKLGLKNSNIQTQRHQLSPIYNYKLNPPSIKNYQFTHTLQISLNNSKEIELLSDILQIASQNSMNIFNSPNMKLSDSKKYQFEQSLLAEASNKAKSKGIQVLDSLGLKYKGIHNISIDQYSTHNNRAHYAMRSQHKAESVTSLFSDGSQPTIMTGTIELSSSVKMAIEFNN